jgi:acyl-CoA reductase-like NAD-dependent aldehyde dehydrogenase
MTSLKEVGVSDKGLCFINGEYVPPASGEWLDVVNPATEEVIYHMPRGTKPDVDKAVDAARAAFDSWTSTPAAERARFLVSIAGEVEKRSGVLSAIETLDNGKPKAEADGDIGDVAGTFRYYAKVRTRPSQTP